MKHVYKSGSELYNEALSGFKQRFKFYFGDDLFDKYDVDGRFEKNIKKIVMYDGPYINRGGILGKLIHGSCLGLYEPISRRIDIAGSLDDDNNSILFECVSNSNGDSNLLCSKIFSGEIEIMNSLIGGSLDSFYSANVSKEIIWNSNNDNDFDLISGNNILSISGLKSEDVLKLKNIHKDILNGNKSSLNNFSVRR